MLGRANKAHRAAQKHAEARLLLHFSVDATRVCGLLPGLLKIIRQLQRAPGPTARPFVGDATQLVIEIEQLVPKLESLSSKSLRRYLKAPAPLPHRERDEPLHAVAEVVVAFWERELGLPFKNGRWVDGLPKSRPARFAHAVAAYVTNRDELANLNGILSHRNKRRAQKSAAVRA
jgi:hypothetical protein